MSKCVILGFKSLLIIFVWNLNHPWLPYPQMGGQWPLAWLNCCHASVPIMHLFKILYFQGDVVRRVLFFFLINLLKLWKKWLIFLFDFILIIIKCILMTIDHCLSLILPWLILVNRSFYIETYLILINFLITIVQSIIQTFLIQYFISQWNSLIDFKTVTWV